MYILGLSFFYHDAAAALIKDGEIVAAAQEERFTRKKHDESFPENSVEYCLAEAGISINDLDQIIYYEKPLLKFERLLETYFDCAPKGFISFSKAMSVWISKKLWIKSLIRKKTGFNKEILFSGHHLSHASSAFFPSPFEKAVIITADGVGEWATTSISFGDGNQIKMLKEIKFPHSLGLLYSAFTYYTGFKVNSGEYKLMGLAPYGKPLYVQDILDNLIDIKDDGSFRLNMDYFNYMSGLTMTSEKFHNLFNRAPRKPETKITVLDMDLASSVQKVTELIMERMVDYAIKITDCKNVCLAGGVALNCVANGLVFKKLAIDNIFIQPAAGDAGGALGAAYGGWYMFNKNERKIAAEVSDAQKGSLLGPGYEKEVEGFLKENNIPYTSLDKKSCFDELAGLLNEGNIIGLFQGRMEYGPRALGSRSIIGDARDPSMQKKMNLKIKYRESFRPFAPIILEEDADKYFDLNVESPYMLMVGSLKNEFQKGKDESKEQGFEQLKVKRSAFPAVTHVDYSARLQTISDERHPFCFNLLKSFKKLTGLGILINTSFNVRGEPIVCTPADAYRCFLNTEIDYLYLDGFLLSKKDNHDKTLAEKNTFELD